MGESAAAAAAGGVHGFPAVLTSFIGRAGPVREVAGLLEEHRLVTVTGPGGVGKTRLAGQVARQVAGRFADGAWLAELAPVRDPAQVAAVVAAALGVREQPGVPVAEALARVLARQQLLLVLDNCEHVIGAAAQLCAGLLAACDDVRVLATSREPLRVAGEARYRLGPLALPGVDDPAEAGGSEAVALFADRARQADTGFALDGQTGPVVARLVARLDGMPLAIELAAARVEALGVAQLLDRLDDRFALLTAGDRLAPGRHRSLAATVEWSYRLLEEQERRVFRAVSVFPGPFTLEAAEAVAGAGAGPVVLQLVDCSLLVPPRAGPDGRSRYVMLETLRAYGAGLLAGAGEQDGGRRRAGRVGAGGGRAGRGGAADRRGGGWPRPGGWMPRTPRCARCWPGPWTTTRPSRCGWRSRWRRGGTSGAGWRVSTRCCARPPGAPCRAVTGGAPRSSGSAPGGVSGDTGRGAGPFHRGLRTRPRTGGRPGRWPTPWPAGRAALPQTGPDRRGGRGCPPRAGPGPGDRLPGRGGAGPGTLSRTALAPTTWTAPCGWPGRPRRSPPASPAG